MTKKLFVGNLSWDTTKESLEEHFQSIGTIVDAFVAKDRETGRARGFGFVEYETAELAAQAKEDLDKSELDGRPINVDWAQEKAD